MGKVIVMWIQAIPGGCDRNLRDGGGGENWGKKRSHARHVLSHVFRHNMTMGVELSFCIFKHNGFQFLGTRWLGQLAAKTLLNFL